VGFRCVPAQIIALAVGWIEGRVHMTQGVPVLIVSGPVGAGKSTIASEISSQLLDAGASHLWVDVGALSGSFPRPTDDPFGQRIAMRNLEDLWRNHVEAGGGLCAVLARVVKSKNETEAFRGAIPGAQPFICQLEAPVEVLRERLRGRELGAGLDWHLNRADELAEILRGAPADRRLSTDGKSMAHAAAEIISAWRLVSGA
jgi:predicted kinase